MKLFKRVIFITLICIIFVGCDKRKKALDEINTMQMHVDSTLSAGGKMNAEQKVKINELIAAYTDFAEQHPADSLSPQFLFESSRLKLMIPDYPAALDILNTIPEKYPNSDFAATSISTAAAICENVLKDCPRAADYLRELKEKYPNHPTAVNVDLQIQYVCDPEGYLDAVTGNTSKEDSLFMEGMNDTLQ